MMHEQDKAILKSLVAVAWADNRFASEEKEMLEALISAFNASDEEALSCVLVRSGQEPVVVNLDIPMVEKPEEVHWVDNIHPAPGAR